MERTAAQQPVPAPANPWTAPARHDKPARRRPKTATSVTPQARQQAIRRQRVWNTIANIGLVAAILLAVVGAWRIAGGPGLPSESNGDTPTAPNVAMQPATPDATEEIVAAPQVATPTPKTDCDFSADIPIFNGVDESPWDGTAVLLTTSGEVVLTCPEESQGETLATTSRRASVSPLEWPGVVMVYDNIGDPEHPHVRVVSLVTGDIVEFGLGPENLDLGTEGAPGSPWLVGPAPNDTADVQILDLRTMQTRLLSEFSGIVMTSNGGYLLSSDDDGTTLALSLLKQAHPTEGNATLVTGGLPGDLLVLDGELDAGSWVSAPDDFPAIVGFEVSPDGKHVALHGAKGTRNEREHTWSIMRLSDGEEVARSMTVSTGPESSEGIWTENGFAYINGDELMLLPLDSNEVEQAVFQADGPLTDLRSTTDGSIELVDQQWSDDLATMVVNDQTPTFYSVDVNTGEATELTGIDVSANTSPWPYPHRFLVTLGYQVEPRDTVTYQVIDAVKGETVGTLDDVPLNDGGSEGYPTLGPRSVVSSANGETEVIAFDTQHIYLMQVINGEPTVRQIASPPGLLSEVGLMASMFLSEDGTLLSLTAEGDESQTRWLLPLDGEPDEWIEVPKTAASEDPGYIFFVSGTGD